MLPKRVLSPELQECMDPNEGSAATGARGRMSRETPKRVRAHRQERTSVPVGCERARRRNQRNLRSNPPSGSSANHGSRRRHPATLHHHPACALVVVHSSHAQALEQNGFWHDCTCPIIAFLGWRVVMRHDSVVPTARMRQEEHCERCERCGLARARAWGFARAQL